MTSLWEILVPTMMRGEPVRVAYHREWDAKVRAITGGLTLMPPTKGSWVSSDGDTFSERMIPVRIACGVDQLNQIIDLTMEHYDQLAVMAYLISSECIIRNRSEP